VFGSLLGGFNFCIGFVIGAMISAIFLIEHQYNYTIQVLLNI
jgi:uncharacterized membrane protein YciS (DUF1049 family)